MDAFYATLLRRNKDGIKEYFTPRSRLREA